RAALEIAWWVLEAKRHGVPLHVALGGKGDAVAVGADFGIQDSLDILMSQIQGAIDAGFPRIKLKFRPGWDLDMVAAVRSTFPDFTFHVDCNAAYTLADVELFRALDRYRLAMIEQPLADDGMSLVSHAELQKRIATPVCIDESGHSLAHVRAAIALGSCKVVNIKMARAVDGRARLVPGEGERVMRRRRAVMAAVILAWSRAATRASPARGIGTSRWRP